MVAHRRHQYAEDFGIRTADGVGGDRLREFDSACTMPVSDDGETGLGRAAEVAFDAILLDLRMPTRYLREFYAAERLSLDPFHE